MTIKKGALLEILLINSFILALFISMISNYSPSSYILKAVSVIVLYLFIYYDIKKKNIPVKNIFSPLLFISRLHATAHKPVRQVAFASFYLVFISFSLFYSLNATFGFLKLLNILIAVIPIVSAFYYLLTTLDDHRINVFIYSIFGLGIISTVLVIIISPFDFTTVYSFSLLRWSHVTYGRFISIVFLISLYVLIEKKEIFKPLLVSFFAGLFFVGTYLSGLRAALLGVIIISIPFLIIGLKLKKISFANLAVILSTSFLLVIVLNQFGSGSKTLTKYNETLHVNNNEVIVDGSWQARTDAWLISLEMIKDRPLFGSGLGGFNRYYDTSLPQEIRYPHNIFFEVGAELGLVGLTGLLFLLWLMFKYAKKVSVYWVVFLGYSLWLALFAKDISTNTLLWMGVVLIIEQNKQVASSNLDRD